MPTISETRNNPTLGIDPVESLTDYAVADSVFLKVFDESAGTYTDYTTEANDSNVDDAPLLPDPPRFLDIMYLGAVGKFDTILFNIGIAGSGNYRGDFEYHNGSAWAALPILYDSEAEIDEFKVSGYNALFIEPPSNMAGQNIDGQAASWIRFNVTNTTAPITVPVATQIWVRLLGTGGQMMRVEYS